MTPVEKHRRGESVTVIDKLRTIETLDELQGFVDQVRRDQRTFTPDEQAEVARLKARFLRGKR